MYIQEIFSQNSETYYKLKKTKRKKANIVKKNFFHFRENECKMFTAIR